MADKPFCLSKERVLIGLLIPCCLAALVFTSRRLEHFSFSYEKYTYFVPNTKYLELIQGGFRQVLADAYYIKGILAITDNFPSYSDKVYWVQKNFEAAITLNPELLQAYFFGGVVMTQDKESLSTGIKFLESGLRLNPLKWEIPYWIGFNYYQLGDYLSAAQFYQQASILPGAPNYLKSNQPMLYYRAGKAGMGLLYLKGLEASVTDPQQLDWIKLKIEWLSNIVMLEEKVREFSKNYGRLPKDLNELAEEGLIELIPKDPFGGGYYLDAKSGKIMSSFSQGAEAGRNKPNEAEPAKGCSSCKQ
ncbi:MAG: hypothetical protein PHU64_04140 [Candidatus Omnitrophica bacterium]|nr:hypothetical protein [Candidatus Omnitrophota bacterium]MDD5429264.1 hypothetical protein [Candidatus Omnitrophota bacterium]